jgi:hypothetical protein
MVLHCLEMLMYFYKTNNETQILPQKEKDEILIWGEKKCTSCEIREMQYLLTNWNILILLPYILQTCISCVLWYIQHVTLPHKDSADKTIPKNANVKIMHLVTNKLILNGSTNSPKDNFTYAFLISYSLLHFMPYFFIVLSVHGKHSIVVILLLITMTKFNASFICENFVFSE